MKERESGRGDAVGFEDGKRGHEPSWPLDTGKVEETNFPLEPLEGKAAWPTP